MFDHDSRYRHDGQLVIVTTSMTHRETHLGRVISSRMDGITQICLVEFRRDFIGADERREIKHYNLLPYAYNENRHATGTVGSGKETHVISGSHPLCMSGRTTTGTKRNYAVTLYNSPVTCAKCLKYLENNPQLKAEITAHLIYKNLGDFWQSLAAYIGHTVEF